MAKHGNVGNYINSSDSTFHSAPNRLSGRKKSTIFRSLSHIWKSGGKRKSLSCTFVPFWPDFSFSFLSAISAFRDLNCLQVFVCQC